MNDSNSPKGDFLTGFAEYCTDPIKGETGKGISYEKAFRYLCEYLEINLYSFTKADLALIKSKEGELRSETSSLYSQFKDYLQKNRRGSYLTKGHLKAAFPYFYEFCDKKIIKEAHIKDSNKAEIISKSEAIALIKNDGLNISGNITFSSRNSNSLVYWANPNISCILKDWWIILNDFDTKTLYIFHVPAGSIKQNEISLRKDHPERIDIQIEYNNSQFIDIRSKIKFDNWFIKSINY